MPFQNRTALVTGASGNIGLSICRQLAEAGVDVAVTDINGDQAIEMPVDGGRVLGPHNCRMG